MDTTNPTTSRLDPIGKLFGDAWKLFNEKGSRAFAILVVPTILIGLTGLISGASGAVAGIAGILTLVGIILFIAALPAALFVYAENLSTGAAWRRGWGLFWVFVWVGILQVVTTMGGFVLLIIPGVIMAIWFTFTYLTMALEGRRGFAALTRSRYYVKGYWWAVLGRMLLIGLVMIVFQVILLIPLGIIFGSVVGHALASMIAMAVIYPFSLAYAYVMYKNFTVLKPHAPTEETGKAGGLLKTAAVIGFILAIVLMVLIIVGIRTGAFSSDNMNQQYQFTHPSSLQSSNGAY